MHLLLVGNYGVGNAGDEILREYFLERFPDVTWQVLSAHPREGELSRFPGGVRSLFSLRWVQTLRVLQKADGMVFGGGSLWTDAESVEACILWSIHAWFARLCRKPYFLAFQGIGPFRTRLGKWLARWVIAHASFISVRDPGSRGRIEEWKKNTRVVQSFDPSLQLLEREKSNYRTKNLFIFIPRFSTGWDEGNITKFLSTFRSLQESGCSLRIISLHPGDRAEIALCQSFAEPLGITEEKVSTLRDLPALLADAKCVMTQRYHGALSALSQGVPFFVLRQEKGDKLDALAEMCGCPSETLVSFSEKELLQVHWEEQARDIFAVRNNCQELVKVGEEALHVHLTHGD